LLLLVSQTKIVGLASKEIVKMVLELGSGLMEDLKKEIGLLANSMVTQNNFLGQHPSLLAINTKENL
jgi:hypothetical protein